MPTIEFLINDAMFELLVQAEIEQGYDLDEAVDRVHAALSRNGFGLKKKGTVLA